MGKKKTAGGLGRSIIRDRFSKAARTGGDGSFLHTAELNDGYDWGRLNLQSVTEQNNLEDFLATAELAGTEFTAEKLNVTFVSRDAYSGIPQGEELSKIKGLHEKHEDLLRIPRRPAWTKNMTATEVDHNEKMAFLDWRRTLALLQEVEGIVMTPYEKNLDFWRQLWRVIERSDVVVQIVDARNPMLFYCPDLVTYVHEVNPNKRCVVLINKADYLNQTQREAWADYFTKAGIRCMFWSALEESERLAAQDSEVEEDDTVTANSDSNSEEEEEEVTEELDSDISDVKLVSEKLGNVSVAKSECESKPKNDHEQNMDKSDIINSRKGVEISGDLTNEKLSSETSLISCTGDSFTSDAESGMASIVVQGMGGASCEQADSKGGATSIDGETVHNTACVYTGEELLDILKRLNTSHSQEGQLTTIGMVGYPNVGKSSTVNAILKMKKVPVSATPGRTKHFQTLYLDKHLMLCDCPGLVFPSFVTTKADLIVNGILNIDQMRDHVPPVTLVCQRLPRHLLEGTYGINIPRPGEGEDPTRHPTAPELLNAYSAMRGFMTANGMPDCSRGARILLKDYVTGKLLYCEPPPGVDSTHFNIYPEPDSTKAERHTNSGTPIVQTSRIDRDFFSKERSTVHTRTAQSGIADSSKNRMVEKPWKKHNNKKKKEKLRRVYAHLDKTD